MSLPGWRPGSERRWQSPPPRRPVVASSFFGAWFRAWAIRPTSSLDSTSSEAVKSPSATWSSAATASASGTAICLRSRRVVTIANATATAKRIMVSRRWRLVALPTAFNSAGRSLLLRVLFRPSSDWVSLALSSATLLIVVWAWGSTASGFRTVAV
jgi:hypothetical protein